MLVQPTLLLTVLLSIMVVDTLTSLYILASMPVVYVRLEKKFPERWRVIYFCSWDQMYLETISFNE